MPKKRLVVELSDRHWGILNAVEQVCADSQKAIVENALTLYAEILEERKKGNKVAFIGATGNVTRALTVLSHECLRF